MKAPVTISRVSVLLIIIIVVAIFLRLYGIDRQSLWYDEIYEIKSSQKLFQYKNPLNIPGSDAPPLNLFFIYPVMKLFPAGDFAVRIVPFIFGLVSVPLFYLLGRRLFNEEAGLIASFLLAISPFHIWYSQDARMYALQWMLVLISLIYFVKALDKPSSGNYIGYLISTVAGLYTLQLTLFLIVIQGLYVLIFYKKYKAQFFKWVIVFGVAVILFLPWIFSTSQFYEDTFHKEIDLKVIPYTLYAYSAGFSIGPSLRELHLDRSLGVIKPHLKLIVPVMLVFGSIFLLGIWSLRKDFSRLLFLLLLLIVPIIGVLMLKKIMPHITYNARYTGMALFAFLLFVAKGVSWLNSIRPNVFCRILAALAIIAMTGFSGYSYANYQFDKKYSKADVRAAVEYIKENKMPDDEILCLGNEAVFNWYSGDDFSCSTLYAGDKDYHQKIEAGLKEKLRGDKRLWLVMSREWEYSRYNYVKAWLETNYMEIKQLHKGLNEIANVRIYCYGPVK